MTSEICCKSPKKNFSSVKIDRQVAPFLKKFSAISIGLYFSIIKPGAIKAWKRHREMTLNLIVPLGAIRFVIYDDRKSSASNGVFQEVILSRKNYCRLTIPPMLWTGFQCVDENKSFLLNIEDYNRPRFAVDFIVHTVCWIF